MNLLNSFLNKTNMYRLAIYYLSTLLLFASALSLFGILGYNPLDIIFSAAYLIALILFISKSISNFFGTRANTESSVITGLILSLIIGPLPLLTNIIPLTFIALAAALSKYFLVWKRRHVFNPVAIAVILSAILIGVGASWWVGSPYLSPLVILFGFLILKKINRQNLALSFLVIYLSLLLIFNLNLFGSVSQAGNFLWSIILYSPLLFFASIMLVEPQTSPKKSNKKIWYGIFTGLALVLIQTYTNTPYSFEIALVLGNLFSFVISKETRLVLTLKRKEKIAENIEGFWFENKTPFKFSAGQFMEWTLPHPKTDSRGIRRYFTIASAPEENELLLATKFSGKSSSFKKTLKNLEIGDKITATGPEGDFTFPQDKKKKLVFIAGGIGITPFRSMIKHLEIRNEKRDMVLLYSAKSLKEFSFRDLFENVSGLKTIYSISLKENVPKNWLDEIGDIDENIIKRNIPDWQERIFYVSGPEPMVKTMEKILSEMKIPQQNIKHDYFPGYEEI